MFLLWTQVTGFGCIKFASYFPNNIIKKEGAKMANNMQALLHREAENAALCQYAGRDYTFAETWEVLDIFPVCVPRIVGEWQACSALDVVEQGKLEKEAAEGMLPPFIYAELCREKDNGFLVMFALDTSYRLWICALDS